MVQISLERILEQLGLELVALLSALGWVILRVGGAIARRIEKEKPIVVKLGKNQLLINPLEKSVQELQSELVTEEYDLLKKGNLILF
jgi:hypothetical protein